MAGKTQRSWALTVSLFMTATALSCGGASPQPHGRTTPVDPAEKHIREMFRNNFLVVAGRDQGEIKLEIVSAMPGAHTKDLMCEPLTEELLFPAKSAFLFGCLSRERPDLYAENVNESPILKRAADRALRHLQRNVGSWSEKRVSDERALTTEAQKLFAQALEDTGALDELVAAWKRNVETPSPCFERFYRVWEQRVTEMRNKARESGACESWSRYLGICTSESTRLRDHIYLFPGPSLTPDKKQALHAMIGRSLSACMTRILEQRDPELVEEIRNTKGFTGSPVLDRLNERAWKIWRAHGIERWLDRTLDAGGEIPPDVRQELDDCVIDRIPEPGAASRSERGTTPRGE